MSADIDDIEEILEKLSKRPPLADKSRRPSLREKAEMYKSFREYYTDKYGSNIIFRQHTNPNFLVLQAIGYGFSPKNFSDFKTKVELERKRIFPEVDFEEWFVYNGDIFALINLSKAKYNGRNNIYRILDGIQYKFRSSR
ncbi:MAG: hypothetical protein ACTSV6_00040 [Candidatus Heimdallarchaeota archaeon]